MNLVIIGLGLLPLLRLVILGYQDDLTANPIEFITRSTGTWALVFLCITLSISPLRKISGWSNLIKYRRTCGLMVFFYACIHFSIWFWLDQNLDIAAMWADVLKRPQSMASLAKQHSCTTQEGGRLFSMPACPAKSIFNGVCKSHSR